MPYTQSAHVEWPESDFHAESAYAFGTFGYWGSVASGWKINSQRELCTGFQFTWFSKHTQGGHLADCPTKVLRTQFEFDSPASEAFFLENRTILAVSHAFDELGPHASFNVSLISIHFDFIDWFHFDVITVWLRWLSHNQRAGKLWTATHATSSWVRNTKREKSATFALMN